MKNQGAKVSLLKIACSGPGVSRTRNFSVTSSILHQLDHCTHALAPAPVLRVTWFKNRRS